MLDPDEMQHYEAWKMQRLTGVVDLSVNAYNLEQEALALAYEAGVRDGINTAANGGRHMSEIDAVSETISNSPYRKPGMAAAMKRLTS